MQINNQIPAKLDQFNSNEIRLTSTETNKNNNNNTYEQPKLDVNNANASEDINGNKN